MRRIAIQVSALAVAVLTAACRDGSDGGINPTGPMLLVGPTATVTVSCPTQMEVGQTGNCVAYGYDSNGTFTNSNVASWSSSNTAAATITSTGALTAVGPGGSTITAVIDGVSGTTSITAFDPLSSITIEGPDVIPPNEPCYWWVTVNGGLAPYRYRWWGGTAVSGNTSSGYTAQRDSSFTLQLKVGDSAGKAATDSHSVTVDPNAGPCPT